MQAGVNLVERLQIGGKHKCVEVVALSTPVQVFGKLLGERRFIGFLR